MMLSVRILKMKLVNQFISMLLAAILTAASASTLLAELPDPDGKPADMGKPVKVFIIMGQSNTLEMGKVKGDKEGSLEYAVQKEKLYPFMAVSYTHLRAHETEYDLV